MDANSRRLQQKMRQNSSIARAALENSPYNRPAAPRQDDDRFFNAANAIRALPRIPLIPGSVNLHTDERQYDAGRITNIQRHPALTDELNVALRYMVTVPTIVDHFPEETLPEITGREVPEEEIYVPEEMISVPTVEPAEAKETITATENEELSSSSSGSSSSSSDESGSSSNSDSSSSDGCSSESEDDEKKDMVAAQKPVAMPTPVPGCEVPIIRAANSVIFPSGRLSDSEDETPRDMKVIAPKVQPLTLNYAELRLSDSESSDDEREAKQKVSTTEEAAKQQKLAVSSSSSSSSGSSSSSSSSSSSGSSSSSSDSEEEETAGAVSPNKTSSESADEALRADRRKRLTKRLNKKIRLLFSDDSDSEYEVVERLHRVKPKSKANVRQTNAAAGIKRKASPIKEQKLAQPEKYSKLQLKHESRAGISTDTENEKMSVKRKPKSLTINKYEDLGSAHHPTKVRATSCLSSDPGSESPPLTANKKLALQLVFGGRCGGPTPRTIVLDTRFTISYNSRRRY